MLVKNCTRSTGEFKPENSNTIRQYDNYIFQVEDLEDNAKLIFGNSRFKDIKVRVSDFNKCWNGKPEDLKNQDVIFAFDLNQRLIGIYGKTK